MSVFWAVPWEIEKRDVGLILTSGNELFKSVEALPSVVHDVDMGKVPVPHFGAHLTKEEFQKLKNRIEDSDFDYFERPYRRFIDTNSSRKLLPRRSQWEHIGIQKHAE